MCAQRPGLFDTCEFNLPVADINFSAGSTEDYCWQVRAVNATGGTPAGPLLAVNADIDNNLMVGGQLACFAR